MNKKIVIQLILLLIIGLILLIYFFKYFNNSPTKINISENKEKEVTSKNNGSNKIKNIEYIATDNQGNKYIIQAKNGYVKSDDSSIIIMKDVRARIIFIDSETIYINSNSAVYDSQEHNTKFSGNILILYGEHNIACKKMNLLFNKNVALFYEDVIYNNINTKFLADKMSINLITKNIKAYMNGPNEKIKIIYKN